MYVCGQKICILLRAPLLLKKCLSIILHLWRKHQLLWYTFMRSAWRCPPPLPRQCSCPVVHCVAACWSSVLYMASISLFSKSQCWQQSQKNYGLFLSTRVKLVVSSFLSKLFYKYSWALIYLTQTLAIGLIILVGNNTPAICCVQLRVYLSTYTCDSAHNAFQILSSVLQYRRCTRN